MASQDVRVVIIGDSRSVERAFGRSSKAAGQFNASLTRTRDVVKGVFAAGGIAVGVAGFARAIQGSVSAASNLEEQMNKVDVVFGKSAGSVQAWSKSITASFGLSRREALETAGTFGQILKGAGLNENEAAKFSKQLTELGADLASFNNLRTDEALQKLRAGLSGEAEPLRALGVDLTEAAVKQRAYTEGIAEQGAELTQQQKVLARYAQILAQTRDAQGDVGRTSDSLANQQRKLGAVLENLQATVGAALLPAIQSITKALSEFLSNSENQARVQKAVQDAVNLTVTAVRALYDIFKTLQPIAREVVDTLGGLTNTVKLLAAAFVSVKVASFASSIGLIGTKAATSTGQVNALRLSLLRLKLIGPIAVAVTVILFRKQITEEFNKLTDKFPGGGGGKDVVIGIRSDPKELRKLREELQGMGGDSADAIKQIDAMLERIRKLKSKKVTLEIETIITGDTGRPAGESGGDTSVFANAITGAVDAILSGGQKALDAAIAKTKKGIATGKAEDAAKERQKAFDRFIDTLQLAVDQAGLTSGLKDDLKALRAMKEGLEKQIKAGVDVTNAQQKLVQVTADIATKQKDIKANTSAALQASQFKALGLDVEGNKPIPGIANLKKQLASLTTNLAGTSADTSANRGLLARIKKVLFDPLDKATPVTREKVRDLLQAVRDEFDKDTLKGPLTKTTAINTNNILDGLGLGRDAERELRARLSRFNSAGQALTRGNARTGSFVGGRTIVVENHNTIELDSQVVAKNVTKSQTKTGRGTRQKRGPNRRQGGV